MKKLAIIYYSFTGATEQMVQAAMGAARDIEGVDVRMLRAAETQPDDLLDADGYIFATPENLAAIAGVMKAFFDRCYYPVLGKIEGRPYAAMICAGSDGNNARTQLERICTGWRLKKVIDTPIICTHAQTEEQILARKSVAEKDLEKCSNIGALVAAGLSVGVF